MLKNLFSSTVNIIKSFFSGIVKLPKWIRTQISKIKREFSSLHYHLNNITTSNMDLGIYHLYNRNYGDAIFRFKLIDKFLSPNDKEANYWLGWVYLLKSNYKKSIIHLDKAGEEDQINLLSFVKSIDSNKSVPNTVHQIHRDMVADLFIDKFVSDTINLPKQLVLELSEAINKLPEEYSILELGSNIGILGYEINKRMQDKFTLTSVEISQSMIKLQPICFPEQKLYDEILHTPVSIFLKESKKKYDVICSMYGFAFEADLQNIFDNILLLLQPSGYFAFAVKSSANNTLSNKTLEFSYKHEHLKEQLVKSGFQILVAKEFSLGIKNNYSIFVCTK